MVNNKRRRGAAAAGSCSESDDDDRDKSLNSGSESDSDSDDEALTKRGDYDNINDIKDMEDILFLQRGAMDIRMDRWDHGRINWDAHVAQLEHEDKFVNEYTMSVRAHGNLVRILDPILKRKQYNSRCSEPIQVEHITAIGLRCLQGVGLRICVILWVHQPVQRMMHWMTLLMLLFVHPNLTFIYHKPRQIGVKSTKDSQERVATRLLLDVVVHLMDFSSVPINHPRQELEM